VKFWAKSCSRFHGSQIDRIEDGFVALGHELAERIDEADIVYSNDEGGYDQIISNLRGGRIKKDARVIFNVLDIPEHNLADYDLQGLATKLKYAHAVTCISAFV
jgi:hypothetical protein